MLSILVSIVLPITSILFSLVALVIGCTALAFVIGLKNSTHQVVWKPMGPPKDPFLADEEKEAEVPGDNPNRRLKREEDTEPLVDLDDPNITSNQWS